MIKPMLGLSRQVRTPTCAHGCWACTSAGSESIARQAKIQGSKRWRTMVVTSLFQIDLDSLCRDDAIADLMRQYAAHLDERLFAGLVIGGGVGGARPRHGIAHHVEAAIHAE